MKVRVITRFTGVLEIEDVWGWRIVTSSPSVLLIIPNDDKNKGWGVPLSEVLIWDCQLEEKELADKETPKWLQEWKKDEPPAQETSLNG